MGRLITRRVLICVISVISIICSACSDKDEGYSGPSLDQWSPIDPQVLPGNGADIIWSDTQDMFVSVDGLTIAFSKDGREWNQVEAAEPGASLISVADCGEYGLLAASGAGDIFLQDEDGVSWRWTTRLLTGQEDWAGTPYRSSVRSLACGNGVALAMARSGPYHVGHRERYYDGSKFYWAWEFTAGTDFDGSIVNSIVRAPSGFLGAGEDGAIYLTQDGQEWTTVETGAGPLNDVAVDGEVVCAVGDLQTVVFSEDQEEWKVLTVERLYQDLVKVVAVDGRFIAFGDEGAVVVIEDGKVVHTSELPDAPLVTGAAAGNGMLVVLTQSAGAFIQPLD